MVEKIRFHAATGFCHRNLSLFWWMIVFKNFFQTLGGFFLDFGKKTSTDCQNCIFICPEKHLQEKKFSWEKTKSFIKVQTSSGAFLKKKLVKKIIFWRKIISTVVKTGLYASRGTFRGKICFPKKKSIKKIPFYFERKFSFFYRNCLSCLSKTFHRLQMKVLRKVIFSNKKFFTEFFQNLRGKLSYFGNESFIDYQKCVSLV